MALMTLTLPMTQQLADELRRRLVATGRSHEEIAQETGVSQPAITRFINGSDIFLSTVQKLADFLDLHWCPDEEGEPSEDEPRPPKRKPRRD